MLTIFSILFITNAFSQHKTETIKPSEGGTLPNLPILSELPAGKIGGLFIEKINYYYGYFNGIYYYPEVHMSFPYPKTLGANSFTLQQFDYQSNTWSDIINEDKPLTTEGDNFAIRLSIDTKYRLKVNGGEKNGFTSNEVTATLPTINTTVRSWSLDMSMMISGVMYPNVGCGFNANAGVKLFDSEKNDYIDVTDTLNFVYEWYRRNPNNSDMTKIADADKATYITTIADAGYEIISVIKGDNVKLSFLVQQNGGLIHFPVKSSYEYFGDDGFIVNSYYTIPDFDINTYKITLSEYDPQTFQTTYKNIPIVKVKEIIPGQYAVYTDKLAKNYYEIKSSKSTWKPVQSMSFGEMNDLTPLMLQLDSCKLFSTLNFNGNITHGEISLYQKRINGDVNLFETKQTENGKATFDLLTGQYYLKTPMTDNSFETYYPNSVMWSDAQKLTPPIITADWQDSTLVIIALPKPAAPPATAQGIIEGTITTSVASPGMVKQCIVSAPQADIYTLYLKNTTTNNIIATTQSNADGSYRFEKVPAGTYDVLVDVPGKPMESVNSVTLETNSSVVDNADYEITDYGVVAKMPTSVQHAAIPVLQLYPNPATDYVYISGISCDCSVTVFDVTGKKLLTKALNDNRMSLTGLKGGLYFITVSKGAKVYKGKFIKSE